MTNTMQYLLELDDRILIYVQKKLRRPALNIWMKRISYLGNGGFIWLAAALLLLFSGEYRHIGFAVVLAQIVGVISTNLFIKNLVARKRPFDRLSCIIPLIKKPSDWSFPSGHTTSSISASILLISALPLFVGIPALILGLAIAFSRMYVGVHYLSDIAGGALMGIVSAGAASFVVSLF